MDGEREERPRAKRERREREREEGFAWGDSGEKRRRRQKGRETRGDESGGDVYSTRRASWASAQRPNISRPVTAVPVPPPPPPPSRWCLNQIKIKCFTPSEVIITCN